VLGNLWTVSQFPDLRIFYKIGIVGTVLLKILCLFTELRVDLRWMTKAVEKSSQ
jgi:hypothetical protein